MKEKKPINKSLVIGIVLAIMCLVCLAVGLYGPIRNRIQGSDPGSTVPYESREDVTVTKEDGTPVTGIDTPQAKEELSRLSEYKEVTGDVYAMIRIPGTSVNYPIAQSPEDDNQYLRHDVDGSFSPAGTLFTEHKYNSTDFSDRVTVVYGHNMIDGTMFGNLQQYYTDESTFRAYKDIYITVDGKELHYEVFAAAPYENTHIMYHYGQFASEASVSEFLDSVYTSREFGVNIDEANKASGSDHILVLSTCLKGNYSKRYIVLAKLV